MKNLVLMSSNKDKLKEFKQFIPNIEMKKGPDLKEVDGTKKEVALYKSLMSGENTIIEDTILMINDEEVVDIKWKVKSLKKNVDASWITTLAVNKDGVIYLYEGCVNGKIIPEKFTEDSFGFDSVFQPKNSDMTLHELKDKKESYSARKIAIEKLKNNNFYFKEIVKNIPTWEGKWQNK